MPCRNSNRSRGSSTVGILPIYAGRRPLSRRVPLSLWMIRQGNLRAMWRGRTAPGATCTYSLAARIPRSLMARRDFAPGWRFVTAHAATERISESATVDPERSIRHFIDGTPRDQSHQTPFRVSPGQLVGDPYFPHPCFLISTRRFLARPSSLPLSAIGTFRPYPCAVRRSAAMPFARSHSRTAVARESDSFWL